MACTHFNHPFDVCDPPGTTDGQEDCYTGMLTTDDLGQLDGIGCENGCVPCRDNPGEILNQGPTFLGNRPGVAGNLWGAGRFLWPHTASPGGRVGADNRQYILEVDRPLWVKPGAQFVLGCCYTNKGEECFGTHSTCDCFNEVGWASEIGEEGNACPDDGTPIHVQLTGRWMDRFFYAGWSWPPSPQSTGVNGVYCRKFVPHHDCSIVVRSVPSGGLYSIGTLMPVLVRSSGRTGELTYGCAPNLFIFLSGRAAASGTCLDAWAHDEGENSNLNEPYISLNNQCHNGASQIRAVPVGRDAPRFEISDNFPLADMKRTAIYNRSLEMLWTTQWPDPSAELGSINFDVLDHSASTSTSNTGLGVFARDYVPEGLAVENYISVWEFPNSRARWGDLSFDMSLIVTRINFEIAYVPFAVHHRMQGDTLSQWEKRSLPFAAVRIGMEFGIRINSQSGSGWIIRKWLGGTNIETAVVTEGAPGTFPTLSPEGNRIFYIGDDGEKVVPPTGFAWRGLLGRQTSPSTDDQVSTYTLIGGTTEAAQVLLDAVSDVRVGAHPALLTTNPEAPQQLWAGQLLLTFVGTAGYGLCMGEG